MTRRRFIALSCIIAGFAVGACALIGPGAFAAGVNTGLTPEVEQSLGLGTQDIRVTAAKIIRNFMGLLGIIAVSLIIYGGFLWMTSGGDEERVDKARKVIISAVIGLAIILSSFAIASFVINALTSATGAVPGTAGGGASASSTLGLFGGQPIFVAEAMSPRGPTPIRNVTVRAVFNQPVDPSTAAGGIQVTDASGTPIQGAVTTSGSVLEFVPNATCPEPNADRHCFAANSDIRVVLATSLLSVPGDRLDCASAELCTALFRTGTEIDVTPPNNVLILSPGEGQSIVAGDLVPVRVFAQDDAGIGMVDAQVDGATIGVVSPEQALTEYLGEVFWDTDGALPGAHSVGAQVFDIDANSTPALPVSVVVRPAHCGNAEQDGDETALNCGGSCGACPGNTCSVGGDCAGGVCRAGICVEAPRIDGLTPGEGGPGTLVTIAGRGFGAEPGVVVFLGGPGQADDVEAGLCASGAWLPDAITISVPNGASDGPIQVTRSSGESDATDDAQGPRVLDFDVTNQVAPGICSVLPNQGKAGAEVRITGIGFGDTPAAGSGVLFSLHGRDIRTTNQTTDTWSATTITVQVPLLRLVDEEPSGVRVQVGGQKSNQIPFRLLPPNAGTRPAITGISPGEGPVSEYVTITGTGFGSQRGKVTLASADGTLADAAVDFPAQCTNAATWADGSVTIKIPGFYRGGAGGRLPLAVGVHQLVLERADGVASNAVPFPVTNTAPRPGICGIEPNNGPPETAVRIFGERLGTTAGTVTFSADQSAEVDGRWSDREITRVVVPAGAVTGPVTVTAGGVESQGVPFTVGRCTDQGQACAEGSACCADGICRQDCGAARKSGAFLWRFSTGLIPHVPRVIEEVACTTNSQSPSPFRDTRDACVNALISLRFSEEMDPASFAGQVAVQSCGAGETFSVGDCTGVAVPGSLEVVRSGVLPGGVERYESRMTFTPTTTFAPGTWYAVTVGNEAGDSVRSVGGAVLDGDSDGQEGGVYVTQFRTRGDGTACAVEHVDVTPADFTASAARERVDYRADATAQNCNVLTCNAFAWDWSARLESGGDASSVATLAARTSDVCRATVTAVGETDPDDPVMVTAALAAQSLADSGTLHIHYEEPRVLKTTPGCSTACVNADVSAQFNVPLNPATLNASTLRIFTCRNESCRAFVESSGIPGVSVLPREDGRGRVTGASLVLGPGMLQESSYYRVIVAGGPAGIRSLSGAALTGANYGDDYSWTFRTRDDASSCDITEVGLAPTDGTVRLVGDGVGYRVVARGEPDDCADNGQELSLHGYSWDWQTANVDASVATPIAVVDFADRGGKDILPLPTGGMCSAACLLTGSQPRISSCGNAAVERGEDCDDGNGRDGDGCSARCLHEGSVGGAVCGNGALETGEDCDDGNTTQRDGCSNRCENEGSDFGGAICGNRDIGDGEDCDDGNGAGGDGCSALCLNEGTRSGPQSSCGNRVRESGEACDDGNVASGDGCSSRCLLEGNRLACDGAFGAACCGNGIAESGAGESCDDGNDALGDGCDGLCRLEGASPRYGLSASTASYCGDAVTGIGEQCEFTPPVGNGRRDPDAFVRAQAGGEAQVRVSTVNASGDVVAAEARFSMACSCRTDNDCLAIVPGSSLSGIGCGGGSCCAPRPSVTTDSVFPTEGSTDVCRNTVISVAFSSRMDTTSIAGNVALAEQSSEPCAQGREMGLPGFCAADVAIAPVLVTRRNVSGAEVSVLEVRVNRPLAASKNYRVIVRGDRDLANGISEGLRAASGVALAGEVSWEFSTGPTICHVDRVVVEPVGALISTTQNNPADDDPSSTTYDTIADSDRIYRATAYAGRSGQDSGPVVPTEGYAWSWAWSSTDGTPPGAVEPEPSEFVAYPDSDTEQAVIRALPAAKNGEATITATATVTADALAPACDPAASAADQARVCGRGRLCAASGAGQGHCAGDAKRGSGKVTVMLCENPWPARDAAGNWQPYTDAGYTFSFSYCRDQGQPGTSDDLPALPAPDDVVHVGSGGRSDLVLQDLLFPVQCTTQGGCQQGDALGMRILSNPNHLTPSRWYTTQRFTGQPVATNLDGYDAIQDGRSLYVHAGTRTPAGILYSNIYLLSYNDGAHETTRQIVNQVTKSLRFNTDLLEENSQTCTTRVCSHDRAQLCTADADCGEGHACLPPASCTADQDCVAAGGGVCQAPKDKLTRDVRRLQDMNDMSVSLESAYATTRTCASNPQEACLDDEYCRSRGFGDRCVGEYPTLASGSFIRGFTTSRWPSWQSGLGNAVRGALPLDPLNQFAAGRERTDACSVPEGYDAGTCWNDAAHTYQCPLGSHVYQYRKQGRGYELAAEFEFRFCADQPTQLCNSDQDCAGGSCVVRNWNALAEPTSHPAQGVTNSFRFDHLCVADRADTPDTVISAAAGICGDGVVGPGEACEIGQSNLEACVAGGAAGIRRWTCSDTCTIVAGTCEPGRCGDNIVQPPETCDDGGRNGTYGFCSVSCRALSGHCGDGERQSGEVCDMGGRCSGSSSACGTDADCAAGQQCLGSTRYGVSREASCAADCRRVGPYCGDRIVDTLHGEECEVGERQSEACGADGSGRSLSRTRTCSASCRWGSLGACTAASACGDGAVQSPEVCDDGNGVDTDACTNSCVRNVCGDGRVERGVEECDAGSSNVDVSSASALDRVRATCPYGRTCAFCTNACRSLSVGGGVCGDGNVTPPYEVCEEASLGGVVGRTAQSACAADCRSACPPTFVDNEIRFQRRQRPGVIIAATTPEVNMPSGSEEYDIIVPACRVMRDSSLGGTVFPATVDISTVTATVVPTIAVLFMADVDGGWDSSAPGHDYLPESVAALAGDGQAFDQLFDGYAGFEDRLQVGLLTFSELGGTPNIRTTSDYLSSHGDFVSGSDPTARVALKGAVGMYYPEGRDATRSAAVVARTLMQSVTAERKVVVLLTDGGTVGSAGTLTAEYPTNEFAIMKQEDGVEVFVLVRGDYPHFNGAKEWSGHCTASFGAPVCETGSERYAFWINDWDAERLQLFYQNIVRQLITSGIADMFLRIGDLGAPAISVAAQPGVSVPAIVDLGCVDRPRNVPFTVTFSGAGSVRIGRARLSACPLIPGR